MRKINVAIADQCHIIRLGLKGILNQNESLRVSFVVENLEELFEHITSGNQKPDVIIIDYSLAHMNNFEINTNIQKILPRCKLLFLTDTESHYLIMKHIPLHVHGFINRGHSVKFIYRKIQNIYEN